MCTFAESCYHKVYPRIHWNHKDSHLGFTWLWNRIDLSKGNSAMKKAHHFCWCVRRLQFIKNPCLFQVFTGGLSSYCLILMVVSFLQVSPLPFFFILFQLILSHWLLEDDSFPWFYVRSASYHGSSSAAPKNRRLRPSCQPWGSPHRWSLSLPDWSIQPHKH